MQKVILRIEQDSDIECPTTWDSWRLYSFCSRHNEFKHPDTLGLGPLDRFGEPAIRNIGLRQQLKAGTAFLLSYFEHGNSLWMLKEGSIPAGIEFQWDGARVAGLLRWEGKAVDLGPKTYADRMKDAQNFLDIYNAWANGEGYSYSIEDAETEEEIDSCGGFYSNDTEYFLDQIKEVLKDYTLIGVEGDAAWLGDDLPLVEEEVDALVE